MDPLAKGKYKQWVPKAHLDDTTEAVQTLIGGSSSHMAVDQPQIEAQSLARTQITLVIPPLTYMRWWISRVALITVTCLSFYSQEILSPGSEQGVEHVGRHHTFTKRVKQSWRKLLLGNVIDSPKQVLQALEKQMADFYWSFDEGTSRLIVNNGNYFAHLWRRMDSN
ncbi:hypothetical protein ACH5RR_006914 [Cinchona calisaya]|uniref:Uncharacterized protein n=1 Tax=Cinchona calisaya TaxID=153742 RepID=A0ABD3AQB5_9GENT